MSHPLCIGFKQEADDIGLPFTWPSTGTVSEYPTERFPHGLDLQSGAEVSSRMNKQVMNMGILSLACSVLLSWCFPMISGWVVFVPTLTGKKSVLLGQGCDYPVAVAVTGMESFLGHMQNLTQMQCVRVYAVYPFTKSSCLYARYSFSPQKD